MSSYFLARCRPERCRRYQLLLAGALRSGAPPFRCYELLLAGALPSGAVLSLSAHIG